MDSALESHPSLRAAEARTAAADAGTAVARSLVFPTLQGTFGATRFSDPMVVAPLHAFDPIRPPAFDRTLVQGRIGLQYTLFDGGARGAGIRDAEAAANVAEALRAATQSELVETVVSAYTGALLARGFRAAAERRIVALEAELDRALQRFEEGTVALVEVMRAEAALLDANAEQVTSASNVTLAERGLARLIGVEPEVVVGRQLADVSPREAASPDIGQEAAGHPRLEAARSTVERARSRVNQARSTWFPTVDALAGVQNFGAVEGESETEWQTGLRLSWSLTAGGRSLVRSAEAEMEAAQEERRATELEVAQTLEVADAAEVADATLEQAEQRLAIVVEGPREETVRAQAAVTEQARANLLRVDAQLANASIVAPFAGNISLRHREPGEVVGAGAPVVSLLDLNDRWVRIYVREDQIGRIQLGMAARITSDTYPDRMYEGEVVFIGNEAEFTPRNVQTT